MPKALGVGTRRYRFVRAALRSIPVEVIKFELKYGNEDPIVVDDELSDILWWLVRLNRRKPRWKALVREARSVDISPQNDIVEIAARSNSPEPGRWSPKTLEDSRRDLTRLKDRLAVMLDDEKDREAFARLKVDERDVALCLKGRSGRKRPDLAYVVAYLVFRAGALGRAIHSVEALRTEKSASSERAKLTNTIAKSLRSKFG